MATRVVATPMSGSFHGERHTFVKWKHMDFDFGALSFDQNPLTTQEYFLFLPPYGNQHHKTTSSQQFKS